MEIISSSHFCSTSLSSRVPLSLAVLVSIVSYETPDPFSIGCINWSPLALSLDFSVVRIVCSFFSSWRLPSWAASFALYSR